MYELTLPVEPLAVGLLDPGQRHHHQELTIRAERALHSPDQALSRSPGATLTVLATRFRLLASSAFCEFTRIIFPTFHTSCLHIDVCHHGSRLFYMRFA